MIASAGIDEAGISILASRWVEAIKLLGHPAELLLRRATRHEDEVEGSEFARVPDAMAQWRANSDEDDRLLVVGLPLSAGEARSTLSGLASAVDRATLVWERPQVPILDISNSLNREIPPRLRIATLSPRLVPSLKAQLPTAEVVSIPVALPSIFARNRRSLRADPLFAVAVGRITARKGSLDLCQRWVDEVGPELGIKLILVGSGYDAQDSQEDLARGFAAGSDWLEIRELGRLEDRLDLLASATCAVFAAIDDHLPQALVEVMASHTPVIATPIHAHLELVRDGVTGYVTEDVAMTNLAALVRTIVIDEPGALSIAAKAAAAIHRRFSPRVAARGVLAAIDWPA